MVKSDGTDGVFKGFHNNVNQGVTAPYLVCTTHTKSAWENFLEGLGQILFPDPSTPTDPTTPTAPSGTTTISP